MLSRPISRLTQPISISPGVGRRRLFLNLFLVLFLADNVAQLLPWSAMATHIGYTELIEYVDYTDDGSYSKLMGWPAQTNLAVKSTRFHNTTLEAWYPDTEPAVAWKPYRIVKKIPLSIWLVRVILSVGPSGIIRTWAGITATLCPSESLGNLLFLTRWGSSLWSSDGPRDGSNDGSRNRCSSSRSWP